MPDDTRKEAEEWANCDPVGAYLAGRAAGWKVGVVEGMRKYAWWKDGVEYVGTCGRTLKDAIRTLDAKNPMSEAIDVKKRVTIWVVTPHEDSTWDECWLPCETDEDHDAALKYAYDRLTDIWDQYDSQDPRIVSVTLQQREVDEDELSWEVPSV